MLIPFFVITFTLTWLAWGAAAMVPGPGEGSAAFLELLILPGVITPAIVALWLTWRQEGSGAVVALTQRVLQWQVPVRWYTFALGYMVAVKLSTAAIHLLATGTWPTVVAPGLVLLMVIGTFISAPVQAGEEVGWRGYALPRLTARMGARFASLVLGVLWALWHLPLFYVAGTPYYGQSLSLYVLQVTAISVAMAWLYFRTGGSLLLVMLMHAAVNNTKDVVPSLMPGAAATSNGSLVGWLTMVVLWIPAAYCLARMKRPNPGRTPE
jgi:membrane protease YdiL (CAAX protease family)